MKILVAYASRHGSTSDIAAVIGQVLRGRGYEVAVKPIEQVGRISAYDAVVLGSALYAGNWMKAAATCLLDKQEVLAQRPVWLFSSGPTGQGDAVELLEGWMFSGEMLEAIKKINPRDIAFFHGNIDPDKLNFAEKAIIESANVPIGDYRDWSIIKAWATDMDFEPGRSLL